jgi:hypothetical protein
MEFILKLVYDIIVGNPDQLKMKCTCGVYSVTSGWFRKVCRNFLDPPC